MNHASSTARPLPRGLNVQLSTMMFLQYAIWGAWLPLLWPYLNGALSFDAGQIGTMFAIGAVGAIVAPFIAGQIADRWFPTQLFLGLSHIAGAVLVWRLSTVTDYDSFKWWTLGYSLIYSPTLSLTNSLAFHHLPDRDRDFGKVRVWGTIGWIVVGITIGQWLLRRYTPTQAEFDAARAAGETVIAKLEDFQIASQQAGMADAFRFSAIIGAAMGVFCFFLPHTPPSREKTSNATIAALKEIRFQPLLTLFALAVPVSCIHQFYFVHTAGFLQNFQSKTASVINEIVGVGGGGLMTIGQMAEIAVLASMPVVAKQLSRKTLLGIGLVAYAARMAIFAYVPSTVPIMVGIAMHGLCFGCFIFVAFMVVDEETTADVRASAQSLFNLVIVGIGIIVGSMIAGWVAEMYTVDNKVADYTGLFSWPMWGAILCLAALLLFYPSKSPHRGDRTT